MRRLSSLLAVAAFVVAAAGGLGTTATSAFAAERCDGVWVVVDARHAGGTLTTRCSPGDPTSGIEALRNAGHTPTYVPSIPGFVCTIDARPTACNGGPADAYWSYWYASAGGSWRYGTAGAGSRNPAPGSVEGWRFGDGSEPPGVAPPAPLPEPEPEPETEPAPEPEPAAEPRTEPESETDPEPEPEPASEPEPSTRPTNVTPDGGESSRDPSPTSRGEPGTTSASDGSLAPSAGDVPDDDAGAEDTMSDDTGAADSPADDAGADNTGATDTKAVARERPPPESGREDTDVATDGSSARPDVAVAADEPPDDSADDTSGGFTAAQSAGSGEQGTPAGLIVAGLLLAAIAGTTWHRRRRVVD